jgi:putative spermidine/putrescine transport system permease protein
MVAMVMNGEVSLNGTKTLKRELRSAQARSRATALLLVAPLAIFIIPIGVLLGRAGQNPEVVAALPHTLHALRDWDRKALPPDAAYTALAEDLSKGEGDTLGPLGRRLNAEISGYRTLLTKTIRTLTLSESTTPGTTIRQQLASIDPRWDDVQYWQAIARNGSSYAIFYVLASVDLKQNGFGQIIASAPDQQIYQTVFGRTFLISAVVTLCALLLGFPLAYWISTLSERKANLVMVLVLIPFWTSILVRVAAWMVILQNEGLVNKFLMATGLINSPLPLLFNRLGVYISMVHILLPFMILPMYAVMKSIPRTYQRAAISMGSHPFSAFWRVYVPQTYPGVGAGVLLVFILAIGYYIAPSLLGGADDQMISYYVAYFTNVTVNWGMACALGGLLLLATAILYVVYARFTRSNTSLG